MRERDGTLVFVEVRRAPERRSAARRPASARVKQRASCFAAQHFLQRLPDAPPCRFDVVAVDGEQVEWLRAAFDAAQCGLNCSERRRCHMHPCPCSNNASSSSSSTAPT